MPFARSASTAVLYAVNDAVSRAQSPLNRMSLPRLTFTTLASGWCASTQFSPATICCDEVRPLRSVTLSTTSDASGATPIGSVLPAPAITSATAEPCPWSSWALPGPSCSAVPSGQPSGGTMQCSAVTAPARSGL